MKRLSILIILLISLVGKPAYRAYAIAEPDFPSCVNPQGQVIASYPTGTHGIAGNTDTFTGSDAVFRLNESQILQCFCSDTKEGIQTNWLSAQNLSQDEITSYEADGWVYIPNGSLWGLSSTPYLAKNLNYSCLPTGGGGGGSTAGDGLSDGRASCPECTAPPAIGGGDVLGLAATGGMWQIYALFGISLFSLLIAVRKSARR